MAILEIPVTKAKGQSIAVDTDALPEAIYARALEEGLKVLLNARMSKVGSVTKLAGEELAKAEASAMTIANENHANLMSGKVGRSRGATQATGESREVITEARNLAKAVVKNQIRASGRKISHVEPRLITEVANELLKTDESFIAQAKLNIEARAAIPVNMDIAAAISESPKLVAKADAAKAKRANERAAAKAATPAGIAVAKRGSAPVHQPRH